MAIGPTGVHYLSRWPKPTLGTLWWAHKVKGGGCYGIVGILVCCMDIMVSYRGYDVTNVGHFGYFGFRFGDDRFWGAW